MRIAIFGLGYVGVVTAACLADDGHRVTGVDIQQAKLDAIADGRSPIYEQGLDDLVAKGVAAGRLSATSDTAHALDGADMAIICVGTPSAPDGSLDLTAVASVTRQIATALAAQPSREPFTFVLRSTILPGTFRQRVRPMLEEHCPDATMERLRMVFHPEFLREGSSIHDFYNPPKIVIGEFATGDGAVVEALYADMDAQLYTVSIETAEAIKYAANAFHALKVAFANEIGQLCTATGVNSQEVMHIFCADRKLNISPRYLRPGFAFGGSCLPKDLRALISLARERNVEVPLFGSILQSNRALIESAVERILSHLGAERSCGLAGLAFKPGTDDLRESPFVELAERLIGKGVDLAIHDTDVRPHRLIGRNKAVIDEKFPHLAKLLVPDLETLENRPCIILGHPVPPEWLEACLDQGIRIFDLTGNAYPEGKPGYAAIV